MTNKAILIGGLIAAFVLVLAYWWADPRAAGQAAAERDLAAGRLRLKGYGLPPPWYPEYVRLLRERYGIEMEGVAGCVVTESLVAEVEGYNERMLREIHCRFGAEALKRVARDARHALPGKEP
jgi:hypothetical protein